MASVKLEKLGKMFDWRFCCQIKCMYAYVCVKLYA